MPANDTYTFSTNSDDGSLLYVDGQLVVDNRGQHAAQEESGEIALEEGYHNVTVQWFERGGAVELTASWSSDSITKEELPAGSLYRSEQRVRWETAADWDSGASESGVVHESFGDRSAGHVELGYPSAGQWGPTPTAYWPLDEDSGSTTDDVTGTNDGTIQSVTLGEAGLLGTSTYEFHASNEDHVTNATDIAALQGTASVSVWVNTSMTGTDTMWQAPGITGVESNGDGDDVFWGWINGSGHVGVQAGNPAGAMSTTPIDDADWHHVVLTREESSGEVEVYVDGTLEDTATSDTGTVTTTFESIGRIEDTGGSPEYFDGRIEDLQVYDRVLTSGEVSTLRADVTDGSLTTGTKSFDSERTPSSLRLTDVDATLPAGTSATVTIESDTNGDGSFEESSNPISVQSGTSEYDVTGLSSDSQHFRLVVDLASSDPTASPTVGRLVLSS